MISTLNSKIICQNTWQIKTLIQSIKIYFEKMNFMLFTLIQIELAETIDPPGPTVIEVVISFDGGVRPSART